MNRRWQLERTLPENLAVLRQTPHVLAVCDYNSADDLDELLQRFRGDVDSGKLACFRTAEPAAFHASIAKNAAHRLGLLQRPDVVFNLDADNYLTPEGVRMVERLFEANPERCLHNWSTDWADGSFGRIAMSARNWMRLGGYDETFWGIAWQDIDLLYRCRAAGLSYELTSEHLRMPEANTYDQKVASLAVPRHLRGESAMETYYNLSKANLIDSFKQPILLPFEAQRRFRGVLNFGAEITL
jgi:hypothetical protein